MVTKKLYLCLILWFGMISQYANATAIAQLDRTSISYNETVQLSIQLDENTLFSGPDISMLEKDFDILGSNKSSQSSWINGKKSANTTWVYELAPKQAGIITIPAINVDGQLTQPVSIQVKPADTNPDNRAGVEPIFIEVITDKDSVYVQEQLLLTVRINTSVNLTDTQLHEFNIDNALIKQLTNTRYNRNINGIPHITYELTYALFPQTSGILEIPAITAEGIAPLQRSSRGLSLFNQGKTMRMRGNPLSITVNEVPTNINTGNWLPAKQLQLQESWSSDPTEIQLGDSITRTITTTAIGLSSEQLPPIAIKAGNAFKSYPDQPVFDDQKNAQGITGIRKDAIALVATKPGNITLPEVSIKWWDINTNTMKTATLPEITLHVMGNANTSTTPMPLVEPSTAIPDSIASEAGNASNITTSSTTTQSSSLLILWQTATAIVSILALLFLVLYIKARKSVYYTIEANNESPTASSADQYLRELKVACTSSDTQAIRTALLYWAQLTWPNTKLHSTIDIARQFNDDSFALLTKKLDAILFSGDTSIENWQELYQQVEAKHLQLNLKNKQRLAPLYPVN